jgi:hypothetical protein
VVVLIQIQPFRKSEPEATAEEWRKGSTRIQLIDNNCNRKWSPHLAGFGPAPRIFFLLVMHEQLSAHHCEGSEKNTTLLDISEEEGPYE